MVNIEKYIAETTWKGLNVLRGYLDLGIAQGVLRELLFLRLLNSGINMYSYFEERIDGRIKFNNTEELFTQLNEFVEKNIILQGLFEDIYNVRNNNDYRFLDNVISLLNNIDFNNKDMQLDILFRNFLDMSPKLKSSINTTSPSIRGVISELLKNKQIKDLYNPSIGYGSLSLEVASNHKEVNIYGQDINNEMIRICKMQLILDKRIEDLDNINQGNTIISPGNIDENGLRKFDCIVCDPPYGLRDWGYEEILSYDKYNRFHRGMPSKSLGDYAFITHVVESLNSNGIAIMAVPAGVLFREGAEGLLRQKLVEENLIDTVIALPNNMMFGTAIPVNLIIFNKVKKEKDILFIDVAKEVMVNKVLTTLSNNMIEKIVKIYEERLNVEGFSRKVDIEEINDNNFNLNVQRYIEEVIEKEALNMDEIGKEIEELTVKLQAIQAEINQFFQ
ncbi:N-6 DNA methylase [Clostridium sp. ZBS15]|uniref:N-6 DNA methylase n=1 Tax=Clostridium sp. ZBS15 TaxID=2949969 RepID=UPI00207A919D|nr:N-6 DNA methylase [Clostridium sp. ZBS15]